MMPPLPPDALRALAWMVRIRALVVSLRTARFQTVIPDFVTYYPNVECLKTDTVKIVGGCADDKQ